MRTILVVEDDRPMQRALRRLFESDGLEVQIASDGIAGMESFGKRVPDAVVLDLYLPRLPGRELCRALKAQEASVPIVVLSANSDIENKVLLLELGADDYVTKPFSPKELLARVRRAMRRSELTTLNVATSASGASQHELLMFSNVSIDFTSMEARRTGKRLALTAQEFKLLKFFASSPDAVISREQLLKEAWGDESYLTTRTVDNYVLRLRQKLEPDPANPRYFVTIHGVGYKFVPDAPAACREKQRR